MHRCRQIIYTTKIKKFSPLMGENNTTIPSVDKDNQMESFLKLVDPIQYYHTFLSKNIRPNSRGLQDIRKLEIQENALTSDPQVVGSSIVQLGSTKIACAIKLLIGTPSPLKPSFGDIGSCL